MESHKIKVLIVDDDLQFLEMMKRRLENKNCSVQCAPDQKRALTFLINEIFHVVFIDCILNEGQGAEFIQEIKKILGDSVEIIMMSGIVPEKSLSSYIDLGIGDFLSKPISEKEIEENINRIREKYLYGNNQNILSKLFRKSSSDVQILKLLISLKKVKEYEFFLYLNKVLSSKESFNLQIQFNNKRHKIVCNKGEIVNYECDNSEMFLNRLLSKNFINEQEKNQLRGQSQAECVRTLLNGSILSAGQISNTKYDMLFEALKEISPGTEISLSVNLVSPEEEPFVLLNQSEYADLILIFLKQKFNNQLFPLFNKEIMEKSLIFEDNLPNYLPEIEGFLTDLKKGMRLQGIHNKYINDKNLFCSYLLYILLKGNVYLSEGNLNAQYHYLYERYKSLYKFINAVKSPEQMFSQLRGNPEKMKITADEAKSYYLYFVKHNHPDTIPFDIPKDLSDSITKVLSIVKKLYDIHNDPSLRSQEDQKKKQEILERDMLHAEKKKICERHLEKGDYEKAFSLIESTPEKIIEKELYWQLLYLWIHFTNNKTVNVNIKNVYKYIKNIKAKARDLSKEKLYYYITGLHYENNKNYANAELSYKKAKALDPTFQPCYPAIKRCSLQLLKNKQKEQPFIAKLKSFSLNDLKKNIKKTG